MFTKIEQTEEKISLQAEKITDNENKVAELTVKAGEISSMAKVNISAHFESDTAPTKANTNDTQKSMLCLFNGVYYYYNDITQVWEEYPEDGLQTMFVQTPEGFSLKGNVLIDGDTVVTQNLKLSGNVTWDMSNSPVLTRYSSDQVNWHSPMVDGDLYMQMSFDGGKKWSTTTKVVGSDGKNGYNGSDANVTPQNVFNALTDNGAQQGIFAAFVNNENQIYINSEYLATRIADVAEIIYIGDFSTTSQQKSIYFNNEANISTYETGVGQNGIGIHCNGFAIDCKPERIKFVAPDGGSLTNDSITLAEYVASYVGGSGGVTAVFG